MIPIKTDNIKKYGYSGLNTLGGNYQTYHNEIVYIYCGRPTPLGNPFFISRENTRDVVIEKFRRQLWNDIKKAKAEKTELLKAVINLAEIASNENFEGELAKEMVLLCYCEPQPCHTRVIASCIKWIIQESDLLLPF